MEKKYLINNITSTVSLLLLFLFTLGYTEKSYAQVPDAQMSGTDAYFRGNYLDAALSDRGTFGAPNSTRPSGYHDARTGTLLGFIANPSKDGWVNYDGDFFIPGTPEEGFGLEINNTAYNNNSSGSLEQIPGSITSVNASATYCNENAAEVIWEGTVGGLNVHRSYLVTENGLFIKMTTTLTNTSGSSLNNIYWCHNVDPDNNQTLTSTYATTNTIVGQASSVTDKLALVKAAQAPAGGATDPDGSFIFLMANDERARVTYGGFANRDPSAIWDGTGAGLTNTEGASLADDKAISIAFNIGTLPAGESTEFTYYYVLTADYNSVFDCNDTDGDGALDINDIDDDNDGITDVIECSNALTNGDFETGDLTGWTEGGSNNWTVTSNRAYVNSDTGGTNTISQTITVEAGYPNTLKFDLAAYTAHGNPITFNVYADGTQIYSATADQIGVEHGGNMVWMPRSFPFTPVGATTTITLETVKPGTSTGDDIHIDNVYVVGQGNDVDRDETYDCFDLDSDNDDCFDALEADENVLTSHLNSDGSINAIANGGTDANGIPNLVNSGGAADIGVDQGQGLTGQETIATQVIVDATSLIDQTLIEGTATTFSITSATATSTTAYSGTTPDYSHASATDVSGTIVFQWQEDGSNLTDTGVYSGTNTATLSISDVTGLNGKVYTLIVSHPDNTCSSLQNSATLTVNADPCGGGAIVGTPTANDPDADGINNVCDLDDDNDGILDSDELACTTRQVWDTTVSSGNITIGSESVGYTTSITGPGTFTGSNNSSGHISFDNNNVLSPPTVWTIVFDKPITFEAFSKTTGAWFDNGELWTISATGAIFTVENPDNSLNITSGTYYDQVSFRSPSSGSNSNKLWNIKSSLINQISISYEHPTGDNASAIQIAINCISKDSDNDTIPDHLEVDSDNDGCFDALEAAGTYNHTQLTNGAFSGTVDVNGVPNITSGGQAPTASVTDSNDNSTCCDPVISGLPDIDSDGIANSCDLDNDNDGILDSNECNQSYIRWLNSTVADGVHGPADIVNSLDSKISETNFSIDIPGYNSDGKIATNWSSILGTDGVPGVSNIASGTLYGSSTALASSTGTTNTLALGKTYKMLIS